MRDYIGAPAETELTASPPECKACLAKLHKTRFFGRHSCGIGRKVYAPKSKTQLDERFFNPNQYAEWLTGFKGETR